MAVLDGELRASPVPPDAQMSFMRKGPKNSSRVPHSAQPNDVDAARAGIRALDCGDDAVSENRTTIVRRSDPDVAPPSAGDSGSLGEQRQSV
jgi:hypothetical protein